MSMAYSAHTGLVPTGYQLLLVNQGRNGKGKSTLLKWVAARRMPGIPATTSLYYVTQDLVLSEEAQAGTPVQFVLDADVERRLLLTELRQLENSTVLAEVERATEIEARLDEIGSATAEDRCDGCGIVPRTRTRVMKTV